MKVRTGRRWLTIEERERETSRDATRHMNSALLDCGNLVERSWSITTSEDQPLHT